MDVFVTSLKEIYKERLLQSEEQWPPVRGDKLINLQLVEADKTEGFGRGFFNNNFNPNHAEKEQGLTKSSKKVKRTPILHCNFFKIDSGKKPVRKIVVEGSGGMGKTTLCTMLAEEWAEGKILTQFDCVLLLPLRDSRVSSATSLPELFEHLHPDEDICKSVVTSIKKRAGKGILIIADGWDELDDNKRSKGSFLHNFFFGGFLPLVSVLLTSRPSASAPLHKLKCVHRLIEIVGFNEENIEQYIQSEFSDCQEKSFSLIEEVESNPLIQSVCSVPLNCAIVCHLWHTLNQSLPSTLTELYTQIVLNIIYRDISKNFPECNIGLSLSNFDSIPQHLQESFWLTCKFAFECLCRDQIVFSEDELAAFFPEFLSSDMKFQCFGLLQSAQSLLPVGHCLSFHFAHLTIQEFLAALHLATLSDDKKLEVVRHYHVSSTRLNVVWRFVFGLATRTITNSFSVKIIRLDINTVHSLFSFYGNAKKEICHFALESKSLNSVTVNAVAAINGDFSLEGGTPYDVVALLHVLHHTKECMHVAIKLDGCGMSDKQLNKLAYILSNASASCFQVKKLDFGNNHLSNEGVVRLLNKVSPVLSSLNNLSLEACNIVNFQLSVPLISEFSLTSLSLSNNPLGVTSIQLLETAVQAGALDNLENISFSNTLSDDADINGALLTTLLPSLASHCRLEQIDLSKNNLGVPGACAVGEAVCLFQSEHDIGINLNECSFNLDCMVSLCMSGLVSQKWVQPNVIVSFNNNSLDIDGFLASFYLLKNSAQLICASFEQITLSTASNYHLELSRSRCIDLFKFCPVVQYKNLKALSLGGNNLSGHNIVILAECIRVFQSLEGLLCSNCSLFATDILNLLFKLKSSSIKLVFLNELDLSNNLIDNEGANELMKNLYVLSEVFPALDDLRVTDNLLDSTVKFCWNTRWATHKVNRVRLSPMSSEEESDSSLERALIESKQFTIFNDWERTFSPPRTIELLLEFLRMWDELLWELCYLFYIMDLCPHLFGLPTKVNLQSSVTDKFLVASSSDDKSFHSATEELNDLDHQLTTTDEESTLPSTQSTSKDQNVSSKDYENTAGSAAWRVSPWTTPSQLSSTVATSNIHNTQHLHTGAAGLETISIEQLKQHTKVTDSQLNTAIEESHVHSISEYFDNVDDYVLLFGLKPGQQTDVKDLAIRKTTQTAVQEMLKLWRRPNPIAATYRALIGTLLLGNKGDIAFKICRFAHSMLCGKQ